LNAPRNGHAPLFGAGKEFLWFFGSIIEPVRHAMSLQLPLFAEELPLPVCAGYGISMPHGKSSIPCNHPLSAHPADQALLNNGNGHTWRHRII